MSNVVKFPTGKGSDTSSDPDRYTAPAVVTDPAPHTHAVQFYEGEEFLFETVGQFLTAGLEAGDRLLVFATQAHSEAFTRHIRGFDPKRVLASGQLTLLDAREMLSKFMVRGMPDADLFLDLLEHVISKARSNNHQRSRVRAFGEMVDVLWRDGNSKAAIRLEELWNDAVKQHCFSLLCAYVMGSFYKEGDTTRFLELCRNHSEVMPTERFAELDDSHARLREISLLQQRARSLETEVEHRKKLEDALRDALREQHRAEEELRSSVEREKAARAQAEASDTFKEVFLAMLGHDLRNPLNTILTTVRLMTMRGALGDENQTLLDRVITSGVRMQRMIDQILDLTRARHAGGIPITLSQEQDLVPLAAKIVEEMRASNSVRTIHFDADGPCMARVDGDRFEQVVSNLIGNAVAHGDPDKPIHVTLASRGSIVRVSVHNYGPPIDPAVVPLLFDPFQRGDELQAHSDGLGLGLYISERIVSAHGGKLELQSSEESGTRFEAIFPRGT